MKIITAMYALKKGGSYKRFEMMLESFLERNCEAHCLSIAPIHIEHPLYHNHRILLPSKIAEGWVAKIVVIFLFPFYSLWVAWLQRVDLFIAFSPLYAFVQALPKWILRKPMVTFVRGDSSIGMMIQNSPNFLVLTNKVIERLGLAFSNRIVTVNAAAYEEISRVMKRKKNGEVMLLFNNIPLTGNSWQEDHVQLRARFGIPGGSKVLVTAGIINRGKNIEFLLRCLSRIRMNNLFLFVVGEESTKADLGYKNYLKELTNTFGLTENVIFTGWLKNSEIWEIFRAADLFILPSKQEGMPNVILEAMATDLLCIGSNIPGIKDILHHEELMFEPTDEEGMIIKIRHLLSDQQYFEETKKICQNRKKVFLFDWKEKVFQIITGRIPSPTIN
jgi:glycosyltransferase involved in cell wall biosynthesis